MRELPPRARAYFWAVCALAGAVLVGSGFALRDATAADLAQVAILLLLLGAVNSFSTRTSADITVSIGFIVCLASVVLLGPSGAAIVAAAGGTTGPLLYKRVFNSAQYVLASWMSAIGWALVLGAARLGNQPEWRVLVAASFATVVFCLVNSLLVACIISLTTSISVARVWSGTLSWGTFTYLGYGLLGVLMAQLYRNVGPATSILFLAPLLVARRAFANYAELRNAYDGTVSALVQAVETKDYYTRGHSERVARVTEMVAREWGMREDRVQVIKIAGMLHDVGKLGVPTRVLQKQGKLSQLEFEAIKIHPLRGFEMLSEIDFLSEAISGVYHHHERMDGRGYPLGLVGEEIPEFARIIMVADAFDSMTSTRAYRQAKSVADAVIELRRCQGDQFDENVVDCLVAGIDKHGWSPHPEDFFGEQVDRDGRPMVQAAAAGAEGVREED
ncbi:MAG TPA: HD-GYP domain-containing protein [Mycobacteriales bacterium]|nr:HD-GYP domain-containing protein [Mycobacteriales bacterium]